MCVCIYSLSLSLCKCSYVSLCLQALERFYEAVMQAILRHINFDGMAAA